MLLILFALFGADAVWARYVVRGLTIIAACNVLGVYDMWRFDAYCFYCVLTTVLAPALVWFAFLF